ncbi:MULTISPECIES: hypothetical protein [Neorhizobium]|uniref:hypothetical protein n=1 Tax=Neorhizobium TaxID=1525371 RepID=UPI000CF9829D|nr:MULTISPECIES: hypothetical protein [Neorhizobium]
MTSISAVQPAALLILQQASAQPAETDEDKEKKADLVKVANGITGEPAEETLKAAFAISVAFMELDAKGELAAEAMEFIDSDQFKVTDLTVKQTLKQVISERGWEFMQLVKQQQEAHDGAISRENLFAIVLPQMIVKNRERFTEDEIELSVKFEDKSGIIVFIPDSEGNSTYSDLMNAMKEEEINAATTGDETALRELGMELGSYATAWSDAFGFKPGDVFMFVDVKDILYAAWMKP